MKVGVPKEIKNNENRVAVTPDGAAALAARGHEVCVERGAGLGAGFPDTDYTQAGARIGAAADAWSADLVVKVKEPLPAEYGRLAGQIVFTFFHLAGVEAALTEALLATATTAIAYETVEDEHGRLPLLAPMSAVAGSMAPLMGGYYLARFNGGRGMLLGEIQGERYGEVLVVGDGVVGQNAARVAAATGARVLVFGRRPESAADFAALGPNVEYRESSAEAVAAAVVSADLVVGAVLIEGARAPRVVTEPMVRSMPEGSVVVDVSIDQGGCVATSRPTTHADPVFVVHGVTHYCVTNMPGAYPRTSTFALTAATLPYVLRLADGGIAAALEDPAFAKGVNTYEGRLTCRAVADALGRQDGYEPLVGA
jgi:alanine dehydrogenase